MNSLRLIFLLLLSIGFTGCVTLDPYADLRTSLQNGKITEKEFYELAEQRRRTNQVAADNRAALLSAQQAQQSAQTASAYQSALNINRQSNANAAAILQSSQRAYQANYRSPTYTNPYQIYQNNKKQGIYRTVNHPQGWSGMPEYEIR